MNELRIAVHDFVGHSFPIQLSRELARRGHVVRHLYLTGFQGPKGPLTRTPADPSTFSFHPISLDSPYPKYSFIKRFVADLRYSQRCASGISEFQPDVVISGDASPTIQKQLQKYCARNSIGFVYWVQDWYGIAAKKVFAQKLGALGALISKYVVHQEQETVADSDAAVLISRDFLEMVPERSRNVTVIENWAPLDELPVRPKSNPWSERHNLASKKVVLYSGTLGLKHNPELLVSLAVHLAPRPDCVVVVISQGLGRVYLEKRKGELNLSNLLLLDFQAFEELPDVIATGDVLLTIIEKEAGIFSVPSKVLTYLCAERPLLLAVPKSNLAARTVQENEMGLVVDPGDTEGLLRAADYLLSNHEVARNFATRARRYATSTFDMSRIASRFEKVLSDAVLLVRNKANSRETH